MSQEVLWKPPIEVIGIELIKSVWNGASLTCSLLCHVDDAERLKSLDITFKQVTRYAIEFANYGDLHGGLWLPYGALYELTLKDVSRTEGGAAAFPGPVMRLFLENAAIAISCEGYSVSDLKAVTRGD